MNAKVVIMSCDAYEDCWEPFFNLLDRYWKDCPYEKYIVTETKDCKYANTIKTIGSWTARYRQALEQLDCEYVITLLDDFFLHKKVNQEKINQILGYFKPNIACFNLEECYDTTSAESIYNGFKLRKNNQQYLCSCQPSIWNRKILIELLSKDMTPWQWETQRLNSKYEFYINSRELIFDIGYYKERKPWAIVQGKMSNDMIDLFEREQLILPERELLNK